MIPLLIIYADAVSFVGGFAAMNVKDNISLQLFFSQILNTLTFVDILPATIKTFVFGFIIGLVGCYEGYNCGRGTESVGVAANVSVVVTSLLLIIFDMVAVQITNVIF